MKNGKKIACLALTAAMAVSCMGAGTALAFAETSVPDGTEAATPATKWTSLDWLQGAGAGMTTEYDSETGFYHVTGHAAYGYRMYTSYKVKLDGLKITIAEGDAFLQNDMAGFGFSATTGNIGYPLVDGNSMAISLWKSLYSGQSRVVVNRNHDYNAEASIYKDESCTDKDKPFGVAGSYVLSDTQRGGVTLEFHLLEGGTTYSLKATLALGATAAGQSQEKTVYFPASQLNVDDEGKAYIISHGFPSGTHPAPDIYIKVDEDPGYKPAQTAVEAARSEYETAIDALKNEGTYEQSVEKRNAYLEKIAALRADDKKAEEMTLADIDKKYTEDDSVQAKVKTAVDVSFTAATTAVDVLKGDAEATAVTQENIDAAKTAIDTAKETYNDMKSMLTDENKTTYTNLIAGYDFDLAHAKAKLWVMGLEAKNAAVANGQDTAEKAELIGEAEAYNDTYNTSDAKAFIELTGHDTETTAMQTRVTAAQNRLNQLKQENEAAVKEYYLVPLETAVAEDLTILSNITDAKSVLAELKDKVEIVEGDGALYTRYTTAYNTLKTAAETYVNGQIEQVDAALDKAYEEYNEYNNAVRKNFNKITLTLLLEDNATIQAAYDALKAKKEAQVLDAFNVTALGGEAVLEQNYTGIYYENNGQHPNRLNYNKPLDLSAGVTLNIELTEIWCLDCGAENENRSNNFTFNFLGGPNEYKGKNDADQTPANSGGFSLYFWMFEGSCSINIMNPVTDVTVKSGSFSTPSEGSVLTIEIKYGEYTDFLTGENLGNRWQILVNGEGEVVFSEEDLASGGMTSLLGSNGKATGYFSVGTYANDAVKAKYPDGVNAFTIISIGDEEFAKPAPAVATATVTASKTAATVGETVTFTSSFTPGEAEPSAYEWYVNDQKQTVTNKNFAYKGETAGTYKVYCKIDGVKSNEVTVTFAAAAGEDPGTTPGETEGGSGCGSEIFVGVGGAVAAVLVVAAAGIVLFARKRKHD